MTSLVEVVAQALAAHPEVELGLLFGSCARGVATPGSDVDLAIRGTNVDRAELAAHLSRAIGREVDLVDLDHAGYPLLKAIVRDGVIVRERRRGAAASWRTHALCDLETDRPWWERMRDAQLRRAASG